MAWASPSGSAVTARPIPTSSFVHEPAEPTRWLWRNRIALEALSSVQGDGASGKSTLARWLAARVSRGELVGDLGGPANVLWLNVEEHARRDIRPGLDRQGADIARIFRPDDRAPVLRFPQHVERLHATVVLTQARLVVIDQVNGFLAAGREHSIREAMTGLRRMAEDTACAVLLTRNLNGDRGADPYRRGRGGGLIVDISRAAFHLGLHPDDGGDPDGRRVLASIKGNLLGRAARALVLGLDATGRVVVGEEMDLLPSTLLARQQEAREQRPEQLERAVAFLRQHRAGREVPTIEVETAAAERGLSLRTINRARDRLGVLHRRVSRRNPDGCTTQQTLLRLPGVDVQNSPDDATPPSPSTGPALPSLSSGRTTPVPANDDAGIRFSLLELDTVGRVGTPEKSPPINGELTTLPTLPTPEQGAS